MPSTPLSRREVLAAGIALASGCTANSTESVPAFDWPQFGRTPAKTGWLPDAELSVADGTPDWSRPIGGGIGTSLVASGDLICFGTANGVVAHDVADGGRRWRGDLRGTPTGTPAMAGGSVVATAVERPADPGSPAGQVAAFDAASGDRRWHRDLPEAGYVFAPTVADGSTIVRTADRALGLDDTGAVAWELDGLAAFEDPTYPGLADLSPAVHDGVAYVPDPGAVVAYDVDAGEVAWRRSVPKLRSAPAVADGRVFVASVTTGVYALDAATGAVEWHRAATGCWTTPTVTDDAVYATANGDLVALDRAEGTERWRVDLHGDAYAAPLAIGGTVVAGSIGRSAVGVDAASGERAWTFAGSATRNTPTAADGTLFVPDGGSLVAIRD